MRYLIVAICLFVLSGCAGSPYHLSQMDSAELKTVSNSDLKYAIKSTLTSSPKMAKEAARRGLYPEADLAAALPKGSLLQYSYMTSDQLASVDSEALAEAATSLLDTSLVEKEIIKRQIYSRLDLELIKKVEIKVGMSRDALCVIFGRPNEIKTNENLRIPKQYVYHKTAGGNIYFSIENDKVTGWKDQ